MKITIECDNGDVVTHQSVTDYYLVVRTLETKANASGEVVLEGELRSFSRGIRLRELIKEIRQSLIELQQYLQNLTNKSVSEEEVSSVNSEMFENVN